MRSNDWKASWQRYEVKYLITHECADELQEFCRQNLPPDPYTLARPDRQYPISSLYLDSPDRLCLRGTLERRERRAKLRIRTYRSMGTPADGLTTFFEIKRKSQGIVYKTRAAVPASLAHRLQASDCSYYDANGNNASERYDTRQQLDSAHLDGLNDFLDLRSRIGARPVLGVFYTREAYETSSVDRVRISFDRNLHYGLLGAANGQAREAWWSVDLDSVILEIKFTTTYPTWVSDMIRHFEVTRRGVCKYVLCSRAAGVTRQCHVVSAWNDRNAQAWTE